jgi:membrane-associated phospholipid phosphatase
MFYSKAFSSIDIKTPRERLFLSALMAVVYLIILKKIIRYHQYIELYPFITGTLLTITGLMIYNYFKQMPSIHAAAMSGAVTFFLIWSYYSQINILNYISVFILLTAIVIAARLYLSIHNTPEIIRGILLGILMQIAGFYIGLLVF